MMKIKALLIFITLSLILNINSIYAIQPAFITGKVYSSYDNSLISGATISTINGLHTIAESGSFFLRVPPNVYDIFVSAPGYASNLLAGIFTVPGQTANVNLWLKPVTSETGYLEGKVIDINSGKGINSAFIATDLGGITTSDEYGNFKMFSPSGFATVKLCAIGYSSKTIENIQLLPYRTKRILLYLNKSPSSAINVYGIVRNACSGTIIREAMVISQTGDVYESIDGSYLINTPSGLTTLIVSSEGFQFLLKNINLPLFPKSAQVDLQLIPLKNGYGLIRGIVYNSLTQEPVEGVKLESDTGDITYSKINGEYELYTSLCAKFMSVNMQGFMSSKIPVSINFGKPQTLNPALDPLATITGIIYNAGEDKAISGAVISIEEHPEISTVSESNGFYILENILPEQSTISVSHRCFKTERLEVTVPPGEILEENILLNSYGSGSIQGFVSDAFTGNNLPSVHIVADHGAEAITDNTGFYSVSLPACKTSISIDANGYLNKTLKNVSIEENEILELDIDLIPCYFLCP